MGLQALGMPKRKAQRERAPAFGAICGQRLKFVGGALGDEKRLQRQRGRIPPGDWDPDFNSQKLPHLRLSTLKWSLVRSATRVSLSPVPLLSTASAQTDPSGECLETPARGTVCGVVSKS